MSLKALAIVFYLDMDGISFSREFDINLAGSSMLDAVIHQFLDNAVYINRHIHLQIT